MDKQRTSLRRRPSPGSGASRRKIPRPPVARSPEISEIIEENRRLHEELASARNEAQAERYRYRELFDLDPDAYLLTTRTGVISEANLAASALFGIPTSFLIGKPLAVYVLMEDRPLLRGTLDQMARIDQAELTVRIAPRNLPARIAHIRVATVREKFSGPLMGMRWILRDITEARRAQDELASGREKLRELASELSLAEERVRREIAIGIHDRVSQPLALAKILLGKFKLDLSSERARELGEMSALIQQAIEESRTLTFELSPPVLYELGLAAAVEWLAEQMQRRHGVRISTVTAFEAPLPLELRVLLFQSIRELLFNVMKHARAKAAAVSITAENGTLRVVVSDNGVGFDPAHSMPRPSPQGFGLFSIRTRVEQLAGQFLIDSNGKRGARITLIVPMHPAAGNTENGAAKRPDAGAAT